MVTYVRPVLIDDVGLRTRPSMNVNLTAGRHILPISGLLESHGEPLQPLLAQAGLPGTCLDDPGRLVPTAALWKFRELAAARVGAPDLTFAAMAPLSLGDLGPVGRSLLRGPTLARTIEDFRHNAGAESSSVVLGLTPQRNGDFFFSVRFNLHRQHGEWQGELYLLAWMLKVVWLVDSEWSPAEIWSTSSATPDHLRAMQPLTPRTRFRQSRTGFPIPASMLALPQESCRRRERYLGAGRGLAWSDSPSDSASGAVKQLIEAYSDDRWLTAEEASDALGFNLRSLQRRLAAEGRTYSEILEATRAEAAAELLEETDATATEIARRLGYSNLSNFNRAFRRWAAVSLAEFRARRRQA